MTELTQLPVRITAGEVEKRELASTLQQLRESYLATLSPHTRRAYEGDLRDFAAFLNETDPMSALCRVVKGGHGEANALGLKYKASLIEKGLAPTTINRRMAALRSAIKLARMGGIIPWTLEVPGVESRPYRDTSGPGQDGFQRIIKKLRESTRPREIRDIAIIRLLYDTALRRGALVRLNRRDVDLEAGTVIIKGKGRRETEKVSLPEETIQVLKSWLEIRGDEPGALFHNVDRARQKSSDGRLTPNGVYKMVCYRGHQVGIKTRPHGFRHSAITRALELTNGNLAAVRDFSRHKNYEVLRYYDDNRQDRGGEVAKLVAKAATV